MDRASIETPVGRLSVETRDGAIVRLDWGGGVQRAETPLLAEACRQIGAYFERRLEVFDLPLAPQVTPFEAQVLAAMSQIPFGETRRYGDLAAALGAGPQAIGQACGANPIPLVIPCHRVVAGDGLGGYSGAGGVETKVALLRHEGAYGLLL